MGDERTYDYTVALRAVETTDFMTGVWSKIPYEVLEKVSSRIVNEVNHVNLYVLALLCRYKTRIREAVRMLSDETSLV